MTSYMVPVATAVVLAVAVFYAGYRTGTGTAVERRLTALLREELAPPRLHSAENAAEKTINLPVVRDDVSRIELHSVAHQIPVREQDLLAGEDSIPGKALRDFYRPQWPDDMDLAERVEIAADSHHERTADAADRGEHQ